MTMTLAEAENKLRRWFPMGRPKIFDFDRDNMFFEFPGDHKAGRPRKSYRISKRDLMDRSDDDIPDVSSLACS